MSKKYCVNCGQLIINNANFCPTCGAPQHGPVAGGVYANAEQVDFNTLPADSPIATENVPQIQEDGTYVSRRRLATAAIFSFFIRYVVQSSILLILFAAGIYFNPLIFAIVIFVYFAVLYAAAIVVYHHFYYFVDETGFQKEYGIIHKHQVTIPFDQIQNVNINRTMLDRILGISRISLETAGNSNGATNVTGAITSAEGYLPGVDSDDAKYLHDLLLLLAKEQE